MGIDDIHYDGMNNLIATYGAEKSGKSLMFISNAMNQPQSTMKNAYDGDVVDGATLDLPGEVVLGPHEDGALGIIRHVVLLLKRRTSIAVVPRQFHRRHFAPCRKRPEVTVRYWSW